MSPSMVLYLNFLSNIYNKNQKRPWPLKTQNHKNEKRLMPFFSQAKLGSYIPPVVNWVQKFSNPEIAFPEEDLKLHFFILI